MKLPKLKIKMPRMKLTTVLWIIFAVIVLFEGLLLYKYLYLNWKNTDVPAGKKHSVSEINLGVFKKTVEWLKTREDYQVGEYGLQDADRGRENPFAE
ncbi:MAG: hypothetical protein Q8P75_02510 [bacterium]|nr:hypothetical protein [bacterium]